MLKVKFQIRNGNGQFEHLCFSEEEMQAYIEYHQSHWQEYKVFDVDDAGNETENYEF